MESQEVDEWSPNFQKDILEAKESLEDQSWKFPPDPLWKKLK